jgi:hypothetical protein
MMAFFMNQFGNGNYGPWSFFGPMNGPGLFMGAFFGIFMLALVIWSIYWKYQAIWYAVKHDQKWWFLAFLIINTVGILEILYLYVFSKNMGTPSHDESKTPMVPPQS